MTVENWVFEAIESIGKAGATIRDIQRHIDEHRYEELAIDTIESALASLLKAGRIEADGARYRIASRTSKEDALKRLFGG
jgi:DNA-binding SARP family transcriptional activator